MREYQQRHIVKTLLYSKTTIVVLFIMIILLARSVVELNEKRIEVDKERDMAKKELTDIETRLEATRRQNEFIKTERGFEEYVRITHPVVKEGEGVIVVYDDDTQSVAPVRESMTLWEKIVIFWNTTIIKK